MRAPLTSGIVCAVLTPVDGSGVPMPDLLADHCRWLLGAGCSSIVLLGTTGEANSFSTAERMSILEGVVGRGIAPSALIVGTGCCAVPDTVALTRHALSAGVRRVLILPPFYYKSVADDGVAVAYSQVIDAVGHDALRVYLYRIPQLSGVDIGASLIDRLSARYGPAIAGIKDSSGDWASMRSLCERFGTVIDVLVGSERFLLDALAAGASGCVTATANVTAPIVCAAYAHRSAADARTLQQRASDARGVFERLPMIAGMKHHLSRRTGDDAWRNVRPPLTPLTPDQAASLARHVEGLGEDCPSTS